MTTCTPSPEPQVARIRAGSEADASDIIHRHVVGWHGGAGPGYAFQFGGGCVTIAETYADTHDRTADRRGVSLVQLVRRARADLTLI
jgi:hypothetical protein